MSRIAEFTLQSSRFLLAAVFLVAGAAKLLDIRGTHKALRDFGVPQALAQPMLLLLPLAELAVTLLLLSVSLVWYGAWAALILLTVFFLAVVVAMIRGRQPDCHCFGQLHSAPVGWSTLLRNVVLAACADWLISAGPSQRGLDLWAWFSALNETQSKLAIVGACAACALLFHLLYRPQPKAKSTEAATEFSWGWDDEPAPAPAPIAAPIRRRPAAGPRPPESAPEPPLKTATGTGLPIGTPAPDFELPSLTGVRCSLQSLQVPGKDLLLVFSNPTCKPCVAVMPGIAHWVKEKKEQNESPNIVIISRGTPEENLVKMKDFDPARVLLQTNFEIAEAYDCTLTPTAVWVSPDGRIRTEVAVGGPAIKQLLYSPAGSGASAPHQVT